MSKTHKLNLLEISTKPVIDAVRNPKYVKNEINLTILTISNMKMRLNLLLEIETIMTGQKKKLINIILSTRVQCLCHLLIKR